MNLPIVGCWGQLMLLFWKLVDETQMGNSRDGWQFCSKKEDFQLFSRALKIDRVLKYIEWIYSMIVNGQ